ncbi:hypothetical protein [Photobacterium sp. GSS17]|uniref:hypothetical protein n=1 Tax=Photobacterium sp. GSS17 TaxID=3020715 RepID=UPI00235ECF3C|nr:hypothetical protein [Photobacterium sp. GSS17]
MGIEQDVRVNGQPARAVIGKPNKALRTLSAAARLVHVPRRYTWVKPGMVMDDTAGRQILLGTHHFHARYTVMLGLDITDEVEAVETTVSIHPVTKMAGDRIELPPVRLKVAEYQAMADNELGLPVGVRYIVTGTKMTREWKVNGRRVRSVVERAGLHFVEVEL